MMIKSGEWRKPVYGIFLIIAISFAIMTFSSNDLKIINSNSDKKINSIDKITGKVLLDEETKKEIKEVVDNLKSTNIYRNEQDSILSKYNDDDDFTTKEITYGDYIIYRQTSYDGNIIIETTYRKDVVRDGTNFLHQEMYDCSLKSGVCYSIPTCMGDKTYDSTEIKKDYTDREKNKESNLKSLNDRADGSDYLAESDFDGTTTFFSKSGFGDIIVKSPVKKGDSTYLTLNVQDENGVEKEVNIVPGGFMKNDKITIGDSNYYLTTCNDATCLKSSGKTKYFFYDETQVDAAKNPDKYIDYADEDYEATFGTVNPQTKQNKINAWHAQEEKTRSQVSAIFNAYINSQMGHLTNVVYEQLCDYEMYEKDSKEQKKIVGIPVPSSSWESQLEKDIYDNMRTSLFVSNVEAIGDSMFRYDVLVKMIGDDSTGKWKLYLKNSCDEKTSEEFWKEEGLIYSGEVFELLLAGQKGDDMIFECGIDPACKFDKVCYKFEDMESVDCSFSIAGSEKITSLCH